MLPEIDVYFDFISFGHIALEGKTAAGIPPSFITCERLRLEAYRKLSCLKSLEEIDDFSDELRDRYGKLPDEVRMFILVSKIRVTGARAGFSSVSVRENKIFLEGGRAGRGHYKIKKETPQLKSYFDAEKKLQKTLGLLFAIESERV
jgi:transcription-repair coupling factor (superfamily II helicase)